MVSHGSVLPKPVSLYHIHLVNKSLFYLLKLQGLATDQVQTLMIKWILSSRSCLECVIGTAEDGF